MLPHKLPVDLRALSSAVSDSLWMRRTVAGLTGFLALILMARLGLAGVEAIDYLHAYNTRQLGYSVLFILAVVIDSAGSSPIVYRLCGICLSVRGESVAPPWPVRAARSGFYWLCLFTLGSQIFSAVALRLPLSSRDKIVVGLSLMVFTFTFSFISIALTGGRLSLIDLLCHTEVKPRKERNSATECGELPAGPCNGSSPLFCAAAVWLCLILLVTAWADWRHRISDSVADYWSEKGDFLSEALLSSPSDLAVAVNLSSVKPPTDNYWNNDRSVLVMGQTEYFALVAPPNAINEGKDLLSRVVAALVPLLPAVDPRTMLIELTVYSEQAFGPIQRVQAVRFLYDRRTAKLRFAPQRQIYVFGTDSVSLEAASKRKDPLTNVLTTYDRHVESAVLPMFGGWAFTTLDFFRWPDRPVRHIL